LHHRISPWSGGLAGVEVGQARAQLIREPLVLLGALFIPLGQPRQPAAADGAVNQSSIELVNLDLRFEQLALGQCLGHADPPPISRRWFRRWARSFPPL